MSDHVYVVAVPFDLPAFGEVKKGAVVVVDLAPGAADGGIAVVDGESIFLTVEVRRTLEDVVAAGEWLVPTDAEPTPHDPIPPMGARAARIVAAIMGHRRAAELAPLVLKLLRDELAGAARVLTPWIPDPSEADPKNPAAWTPGYAKGAASAWIRRTALAEGRPSSQVARISRMNHARLSPSSPIPEVNKDLQLAMNKIDELGLYGDLAEVSAAVDHVLENHGYVLAVPDIGPWTCTAHQSNRRVYKRHYLDPEGKPEGAAAHVAYCQEGGGQWHVVYTTTLPADHPDAHQFRPTKGHNEDRRDEISIRHAVERGMAEADADLMELLPDLYLSPSEPNLLDPKG